MNKINVKCPNCGELFTTENQNETTCQKCNATFSTDKGAKFYTKFSNIERKKLVEAKGEAYLKVDKILDEINYYLDSEEFEKAEELSAKLLEVTEVDFRVYKAIIYAKTHNFQNLQDTSHIPYVKKAIKIANEDEKNSFKKEYQEFYQKQKMTTEELEEYTAQKEEFYYSNLEKVLKDGIPRHYQKEKLIKVYGILSIISLIISLVLSAFSFITNNIYVFIANSVIIVLLVATVISYISTKEKVHSFNLALDIFDNYRKFNIRIDKSIQILQVFISYGNTYLNNSSELSLSMKLNSVINLLIEENDSAILNFLSNNKLAKKYIKDI